MNQKQKGFTSIIIISLIALVLLLAGGSSYYLLSERKQVTCGTETKICSDGSLVKRVVPNCEFAACPEVKISQSPSIVVTSPNGGEAWTVGQTYNINWTSSGVDKVNIYLQTYSNSGVSMNLGTIATGIFASLGTYSWTVPNGNASDNIDKQIVIVGSGGSVSDTSNQPFAITVVSTTCDQKCKVQGYPSGSCQSFAVSPEGFAQRESYGKTHSLIEGETSDCYVLPGMVGASKNCYCNPLINIIVPTTCDQKCKVQGYPSGSCQSFAVSPEGFAQRESYGKNHSLIEGETSDCYVLPGMAGASKNCYCN